MPYLIMALEAFKVLVTIWPALSASFMALLKLLNPTDATVAMNDLGTLSKYWDEAFANVAALTFSNDDPVANSIGQWNSALATVKSRAAADGLTANLGALLTAGQLASHKLDIDTPLDALATASPGVPILVPDHTAPLT